MIVCVASCWDYDPTSKHQIMRILARTNDVIWVNYHGTRRPGITMGDLRDAVRTLRRVTRGMRRVSASMTQITPLVLPGATGPLWGALHRKLLIAQIGRAIRATAGATAKPIQIWSFAPDVPFLAGRFNEELFVYYCVDEFSKFAGAGADAIHRLERRTLERADLVVVTSSELERAKAPLRRDVHLVRHGVEFDHFARAWRTDGPRPSDLPPPDRPVLGFFGLIHQWVDVKLIERVARNRPEWSFVLIGEAKIDVSALRRLDNVRLLGRRPYADLPDYCRHFDVALLPFVTGSLTREINPIKLREYLAAGLPVVSTPLPEAVRYQGPVRLAADATAFEAQCQAALNTSTRADRERIAATVADESWERVVARLSRIVTRRLPTSRESTDVHAEAARPPAIAVPKPVRVAM